MNNILLKLYIDAVKMNHKNILNLLDKDSEAQFLDLGCDDGILTKQLADIIGTSNVYGVEIVEKSIAESQKRGIKVSSFDLNKDFDFKDNSFDVVHANQVIEHLYDSDKFLSEIYRVLKPNGYAIISTENASSWCNIFSSIMGWQIFSLTNFSNLKNGIGNPISLKKNDVKTDDMKSWNHIRIYNFLGLKEYFETVGFDVEGIRGSGYFPLPSFIGNIDKVHSHFITFKIRKSK
jgi:SAM-dependent methyltransferase